MYVYEVIEVSSPHTLLMGMQAVEQFGHSS